PGDFWANHTLGHDLAHVGKHAEAIRYYTAALSQRPDNPGVLLNRASSLHKAGELDAAIADLQQAIAVAPRYVAAHHALGPTRPAHRRAPPSMTKRSWTRPSPPTARRSKSIRNTPALTQTSATPCTNRRSRTRRSPPTARRSKSTRNTPTRNTPTPTPTSALSCATN